MFWCIFSCLFWVTLPVPVQVIAWRDLSPKWPVICVEQDIELHSLTHSLHVFSFFSVRCRQTVVSWHPLWSSMLLASVIRHIVADPREQHLKISVTTTYKNDFRCCSMILSLLQNKIFMHRSVAFERDAFNALMLLFGQQREHTAWKSLAS